MPETRLRRSKEPRDSENVRQEIYEHFYEVSKLLGELSLQDEVSDALGLSPRQAEVLEMIAEGWTNNQIADELGVTYHTVKFHLGAIFRQLGVENRTEAARVYLLYSIAGEV